MSRPNLRDEHLGRCTMHYRRMYRAGEGGDEEGGDEGEAHVVVIGTETPLPERH